MRGMFAALAVAAVATAACSSDDTLPKEAAPVPGTTSPTSEATVLPNSTDPEELPWGPTVEEYEEAESIVSEMSLEQRAGQVIVANYSGTEPPVDLIAELGLGGIIVMADNIESPEQLRRTADAVQSADDRSHPLIMSIDQEGGGVARVREPATEFPSYMSLGAARDPELAAEVAQASGEELRAMGFTMVFAPDADVTTGPDDPTIGSRSASSDPTLVSDIVAASVRGYRDAGIVPVAKHFPGHGSVPADSHEELPVQRASLDDLRGRDFVPFRGAVDAGIPAIMMAHIDLRTVDADTPASLSGDVADVLRSELEFEGLIVTDALDMAAVADEHEPGEAAVRALEAGADIVLMPADVREAHAAIVEAVDSGRLPEERLEEAATRGVATMLHQQNTGDDPELDVLGSHGDLSYRVSLSALTVVSGECEGPYVGDSIEVVGGREQDRARLAAAAEAAGLDVGSGDVVRLLGAGDEPAPGDVVVTMDTPYVLGESEASTARLALYGRTPAAFRALVDVLRGEETAHGRLPVDVDGADQLGCPSSPGR
ncbi:beta-N-acetylhexosaminidase [Actinobacteria bacterium YIM 96077]|uniref:Beta-N-acetylhexosaminidase n=1 Tax=Phytoactinopolyspora halophila TaxID=1981511 RepID=A0A329QJT5_9ACTN|nr:glycoside hydrolase family 3 protein [Phytoactinopolyspora halophila]AYY15700.1 beta-N-acetylhexosaminidase [Actinobacteria bacterium YIM 96077]RAW11652.1 beta-N-acetylhexosaminidase [Phytoactinopolyspora halophila]